MLLSAMRAEQQKTRRQHHVQMAESTRRNAADTESALRAALNQVLEARKEAAFFREEAARAKDEAMIARKGMWLGLLVALVSVLISASSHWAYVSSGGG
ncbi:Uncharacterised protein [Delftia tsuruhatensis]|uniref:hypothetical protein n=1 Tax=Delftia tsuruhatensis TaxID=180282 RepID=UPI001E735EEC|nr:hypothetical protein [Delftia tsuruhatensis]CAB5707423.1 Uncharacterised protein [Delftia tsuruhatensis]CAC9684891.1 Uncharacterised protein [Delftia tsuruhatensis]